ncbi:N-acetylmuramidase domain-containing protein [Thermocoleostomius sinensis]|jgi:hypothetical protein|uniref:N-acetylmuramidase domain-containing protein n=1 Tax=Thermocoleostomius sinensis A174 TaxID=2016057 RepID=A0A9E8ZAP6_9CYAN|nr:N-acetylmuramidase domain-containing protein [Thermocoleostomius sinensis]WAL59710.1 N-acetylmuramidase domain-containing protein [Thermocoleostomius sinensis A174]
MKLADLIHHDTTIDFRTLQTDTELLEEIQARLASLRFYPPTDIDGLYGPLTKAALAKFCDAFKLDSMRHQRFGKAFAKHLLHATSPKDSGQKPSNVKVLTDADYHRAADRLAVEVAAIRAIVAVETEGSGFLPDGRPKILFERHWFWSLTPLPVSQTRPDLSNPEPGGYLGGVHEWERLNAAIQFDRPAALKAASWGLGQILGVNHELAGYKDIEAFVQAMHDSEGKQLDAMMNFIIHQDLVKALQHQDWKTFARVYNGPAGVGVYDLRLAKMFKQYQT